MATKSTLLLLAFAYTTSFALTACEGGKSRPAVSCGANEVAERGVCKPTITQCTGGEVFVDGRCTLPKTACAEGLTLQTNRCIKGDMTLEVLSQSACYNPSNGTTRIILQYITRDEAGYAISPELGAQNLPTALNNHLLIDGSPVDVESQLAHDSELLTSDLLLSLVLDTSSSILEGSQPAFGPMKAAAREVLLNTQNIWKGANSNFYWELAWFNNFIYIPTPNNADEPWGIDDIKAIPAPDSSGSFTALYKAVDYMIKVHAKQHAAGTASGSRDQHVMVVFSDGADNYSHFDNATHLASGDDGNLLFWKEVGAAPVSEVENIAWEIAPPNLRVYVIGIGTAIDTNKLQSIAANGKGQYLYGEDTSSLEHLFSQVQKKLVTQQTFGVETPLRSGEHELSLTSERISDKAQATHTWSITAGATLPECAPQ